jgi:hypothetical protein
MDIIKRIENEESYAIDEQIDKRNVLKTKQNVMRLD